MFNQKAITEPSHEKYSDVHNNKEEKFAAVFIIPC